MTLSGMRRDVLLLGYRRQAIHTAFGYENPFGKVAWQTQKQRGVQISFLRKYFAGTCVICVYYSRC